MRREFSAGIIPFYTQDQVREYLLLHYRSGHFDFPKGHLEANESNEDAAIRELNEETGLSANILPGFIEKMVYFFMDSASHEKILKSVHFFVGETNSKDVVLSEEHSGFIWLPYEQAVKQITFKKGKELLRNAEAFLKLKG